MAKIINRRINPQTTSRKKLLMYFSLSFICMMIGTAVIVLDPIQIISELCSKIKNGSAIYKLLVAEMPGVYLKSYLFNVTNAERFLKGADHKLKVEEVGPFTYREIRSQDDLVLNPEEGTMAYSPHTRTEFVPEESIADPNNVSVTMPNIAMLSMTSMISEFDFFTKMGFNILTTRLNSQALRTMKAYDYLWGYNEDLITLGNKFLPGWISFGKMGILDRLYDNTVPYRIDLGATDYDKFEIKAMNGYNTIKPWDDPYNNTHSKCNTFKNAYEGIGYPSRMTPESEVRIYRNVLCRFLELDYQETRTMDEGAAGLVYTISNRTFTINPDTECLCRRGMCIDGMSDLSPCFYGLPLSLSAAHYTGADPKLYSRIEGIKPDEERHKSYFIIEPRIGLVLGTSFSVQVNIVIKNVKFNSQASKFSDMVVPVAFFNIVQPPLKPADREILRQMYSMGPKLRLSLIIVFYLLSFGLFSYWLRLLYWNWVSTQDKGIAFQAPDSEKGKDILMTEMPLLRR